MFDWEAIIGANPFNLLDFTCPLGVDRPFYLLASSFSPNALVPVATAYRLEEGRVGYRTTNLVRIRFSIQKLDW